MTPLLHQEDVNEFPWINIDEQTRAMIALTRWAVQERQEAVHFYSDGSVKNHGTEDISLSFGSVFQCVDGSYQRAVTGTTSDYASSTKAELVGLLATVLCCPRDRNAIIHIDNMAVVLQFNSLVKNRHSATPRQLIRSTYANWWAVIHEAYLQQGSKVKVRWVRGHNGNEGNEAADKLANKAHNGGLLPWTLNTKHNSSIRTHLTFCGHPAEDDLRGILKQQSALRNHYDWTTQNRVKQHIKQWDEIEWRSSLAIIHDYNPAGGFFTSQGDCDNRAHRIKKIHGMLPTMRYMHYWKPRLYRTDRCRVCLSDVENTSTHGSATSRWRNVKKHGKLHWMQ